MLYGHKSESIPSVLIPDGIEVLINLKETDSFLIQGVQVKIPGSERQLETLLSGKVIAQLGVIKLS